MATVDTYIAESRQEFEALLGGLVRVPTISAQPERGGDIRRGADLAAQVLRSFGARAEIAETAGNPVVLGAFVTGAAHPTVTVYNHLDVQPAQEEGWTRDPFAFAVEDGRYLGRGATDDKGPALTTLFAARYSVQQGVPINIRFVWELEEEIGSPNFETFLAPRASSLKCDSVLISDTIWVSRDIPALPYALRGLQGARLILETGAKEAHSGLTGGAARNPIAELCQIIARCHDAATGKVLVPGFYDDALPVDEEEMRGFLASGFSVGEFMRAHGFTSLRTQDLREVLERIWCRPTFEVHGIVGGYTGPGIKTVVPPRAEAKVSMRLVPGQDPQTKFHQLERFVQGINPDVLVEPASSLAPYLGERGGPYADAARQAVRSAFGRDPAFTREGGSIGAVVSMRRLLGAPIVFMGLSLPEHGYHAPNEYFDWRQASGGMRAMAEYFRLVSKMERKP